MDIHAITIMGKCLWQAVATGRAIYLLWFKKEPESEEKGWMWLAIACACSV